jgi:hypothetical protein
MGARQLIAVTAAAALGAGLAAAPLAAPRGTSDNWAGYATFGSTFTSVSGSWVQPAAQCFRRPTSTTEAAFWVGLGGNEPSSNKVEQIGTEADCDANGQPDYYGWYELWPAYGHDLNLDVLPGDLSRARVVLGRSTVRFSIDDVTGGQSVTRTLRLSEPDGSSVEWIAEAPAVTVRDEDQIVPLTDFGTLRFSGASATSLAGHTGAISDPAWHTTAIDFLSDRGSPRDPIGSFVDRAAAAHGFPSDLSRRGTAFTITWQRGFSPASRPGVPPEAA